MQQHLFTDFGREIQICGTCVDLSWKDLREKVAGVAGLEPGTNPMFVHANRWVERGAHPASRKIRGIPNCFRITDT